ncbi:hypothetical protein ACJJTC_005529 [Scirpophaga incertulas]
MANSFPEVYRHVTETARGLCSLEPFKLRPRSPSPHSTPLSTVGPWAARDKTTTYLFDLEVLWTQRLLDLLVHPARRRLHRAAEPVQHAFERELLHRESSSVRESFVRGPLAPAATSQPSAADSEPVLAEGRSVAPALFAPPLRRPPGPPPTPIPTRARHADDRRKLGEAPPPECTAMRLRGRSIAGTAHAAVHAHCRRALREVAAHWRSGVRCCGRKERVVTIDARGPARERDERIAHVASLADEKLQQLIASSPRSREAAPGMKTMFLACHLSNGTFTCQTI